MAQANTLKVVLEGVDKVSGTVTGIENRFKKLQKVMTAVVAVKTAQKFGDMAIQGAKFRAQLKGIGGDSKVVQKELNDLSTGLEGSFSMGSLVQAKAKVKAFNLDLKFTPAILKNIQNRAMLMGIDTSYALESVTTGISRQSNKWLDNIGIIVKADEAYLKMANSLGKTTKELTDQEKQAAFTRAAIEAMSGKTAEVPAVTLAAQQAQARWSDAWAALNDGLAEITPVMASLAGALKELFSGLANILRPIFKMISAVLSPLIDALTWALGHVSDIAKMFELTLEIGMQLVDQSKEMAIYAENQRITQEGIKFTAEDIEYIYRSQETIQRNLVKQAEAIVALKQKEKELAEETADAFAKFTKRRLDVELKVFDQMSLKDLKRESNRKKFFELRGQQIDAEQAIREANIRKEFRLSMASWETQFQAQKELLKLEKSRAAVRISSLEATLSAQFMEMKTSGKMTHAWLEAHTQALRGVAALKRDLSDVGDQTEALIANHNELRDKMAEGFTDAIEASADLAKAQLANVKSEYDALIANKANNKSKSKRLAILKRILEETERISEAEELFKNRQRGLVNEVSEVLALKIKIKYAQRAIEQAETSLDLRKAQLEKKTLSQDVLELTQDLNAESYENLRLQRLDNKALKGTTDYARQILGFERDRAVLLDARAGIEQARDQANADNLGGLAASFNMQLLTNDLQLEALNIERERLILAEQIRIEAEGYYKAGEAFTSIASDLGDFDAVNKRVQGAFGFMGQMLEIQGALTDGSKTSKEAFNAQADAVTGLALNFIEGERAKAAVLALKHSALAAANWFNPWAAGGHAAAAAAFAAIAGGAGSTGGGSTGGGVVEDRERDDDRGSGPSQIVVNFGEGVILGDAATLGSHIAQATGQAGKAGYGGAV